MARDGRRPSTGRRDRIGVVAAFLTKLPHPPARLPVGAEPVTLDEGTLLWRVYRAGGRHPMTWNGFRSYGPIAAARFDHHEPPPHDDPSRSIFYASDTAAAAIVETFQDTRVIDRLDREPWLVGFELALDVVGLDLTGAWPTQAGASQAISSGRRDIARAWSRRIWSEYVDLDGLWYPSAMFGAAHNLAAYERSLSKLPGHPALNLPLSHRGLEADLNRIAAAYGFDIR
jgi:hypothetical protein